MMPEAFHGAGQCSGVFFGAGFMFSVGMDAVGLVLNPPSMVSFPTNTTVGLHFGPLAASLEQTKSTMILNGKIDYFLEPTTECVRSSLELAEKECLHLDGTSYSTIHGTSYDTSYWQLPRRQMSHYQLLYWRLFSSICSASFNFDHIKPIIIKECGSPSLSDD